MLPSEGGVCVPEKWESQNHKWASTPQVPGCSTYGSSLEALPSGQALEG